MARTADRFGFLHYLAYIVAHQGVGVDRRALHGVALARDACQAVIGRGHGERAVAHLGHGAAGSVAGQCKWTVAR